MSKHELASGNVVWISASSPSEDEMVVAVEFDRQANTDDLIEVRALVIRLAAEKAGADVVECRERSIPVMTRTIQ